MGLLLIERSSFGITEQIGFPKQVFVSFRLGTHPFPTLFVVVHLRSLQYASPTVDGSGVIPLQE